ncbi:MAG: HAD family hydrolase [Lentisphaerae bacterium]|nr:HAD family hydrolase [Lentisphaerota bacterium]
MFKALIFDINGTLSDICTSESDDNIYRTTANFMDYYGVKIAPEKLKEEYFTRLYRQKDESSEEFPEFDVVKIFAGIGGDLIPDAAACARVFRAAGRYKLQLYDGVGEVLDSLRPRYRMGAVTDGQSAWARAEMASVGLDKYFETVTVSGDLGFRKPDLRIFQLTLQKMALDAGEVLFIGNDMYRDISGACQAGMKTVFFRSNQGDQEYRDTRADYVIYNFRELPEALAFLER